MIAYLVEVGILLTKDHKDFDFYASVYDKKHGYYDENQFYTKTKKEAIEYAKKYVYEGVDATYAVISETTLLYDFDFENQEEVGYETYLTSDIVYSIAKIDSEIKENFVLK